MKVVRKILFYTAMVLGILLVSMTVSVFLFKEKIINRFISAANERLNTPVTIGKMDVSMFADFPSMAIVLNDVYIEDSHPGQYPLLTAKRIAFSLNPIEVWGGTYTVRGLEITDSETNLKINKAGKTNYNVVKETEVGDAEQSIGFELKNVKLTNTLVRYVDVNADQDLSFTSEKLLASISSSADVYSIEAEGELTTKTLSIEGRSYLVGKSFGIKSDLVYDDIQRSVLIKASSLEIKGSTFLVSGSYSWKDKNLIALTTEGKDTNIQTLLSLMPDNIGSTFAKYQSKGDMYFKASLKGEVSPRRSPSLTADFGFTDATLFHPDYKTKIENATLTGSFASSAVADPEAAVLILKDIRGIINGEEFTSNVNIRNFQDPEVICDFKGRVNAASLVDFYPVENFSDVQGSILANVAIEGKLQFLKKKTTAQRVSTRGSIELDHIRLKYGKDKIALQDLNGSLQFNNNDLALSNVTGKMGNSDFVLNGFFKNIITFLLFENQPIGIETDLSSSFIDLDELFALGFGTPSGNPAQEYQFSISPHVNLNFNCDVAALRYKRFHAENIKGDLLVKGQVAVSRNLTFKTMGGEISLSGIVDAKNNKAIDVVSTAKLTGIMMDSAFYVFQNFDQTFIEDKHLKGQAYADVSMEMSLNQHLKLFPETLIADISAVIKNGELNNFEPMNKLKRFVKDDGLSHVKFSDLKNDIHIEKKTIYIPQMEVRTNITELKISGTHTFDQRIDYRVVTPLRKRSITDREAQGAIEDDGNGQSKLFLKIIGTTDDYRVVYDTESVRKKIANDLKNEVKELKDAFKNKGTQKKKELELEKDDYFDWEQ